jgi:hypothetical protein
MPTDHDLFADSLRLFDRPEAELHDRVLDHDTDIDGFVERAFGNVTIPPG